VTDDLAASLRDTVDRTVRELAAAGARTEALARFEVPRRILGIARDPRMVSLGRVWRLGVFLLDADGVLYAIGSVTRATPPGHPGYQAASTEARREFRGAAYRGSFEPGETVNHGAEPIALDPDVLRQATGPLFVRDDAAFVRWSASAPDSAALPFQDYLAERVDLLEHPPEGATPA
jgi:hypothetical protein